jgi:hypothetical protein
MRRIVAYFTSTTVLFALLATLGCNKETGFTTVGSKIGAPAAAVNEKAAQAEAKQDANKPGGAVNQAAPPDKAKPEKPRKIKFTSEISVVVENLDSAQNDMEAAVKNIPLAYISHSEINSSPTTIRTGTWRIRVPNDQREDFCKNLLKLGEIERYKVDSQDLTAEYYDLEAHVGNRKLARETVQKLLAKTGDRDVDQYKKVQDMLDNINDEINRLEGKLKLWADVTDLTTITLIMREKQKYIAPKGPELAEVPTFGMRADRTFGNSWDALVGFAQALALASIAVAPWLPVMFVPAGLIWLTARVLRKRS